MYSGGSVHRYIELECQLMLTSRRIKSLSDDYKDTVNVIEKGAP